MDFAQRLGELMDERELSNLKLAKAIGLSDRLIGGWRKGEGGLNLTSAIALADFFGVSLDYLSGRSDERNMVLSPDEITLVNIYRERGRGTDYFGELSDFFPEIKKEPPLCSEEAAALGARYDALDDDGKTIVRCSVINEERRLADDKKDGGTVSEGKAV